MPKSYAQEIVEDIYKEGDRDYHFFSEILGYVEKIYIEPIRNKFIPLNKTTNQIITDALVLAGFMINSGAYVGIYMREYKKVDKTFKTRDDFSEFIWSLHEGDPLFIKKISRGDDFYTIALEKIQVHAAPPELTLEVIAIFENSSR
jgi:hypothetical protein